MMLKPTLNRLKSKFGAVFFIR